MSRQTSGGAAALSGDNEYFDPIVPLIVRAHCRAPLHNTWNSWISSSMSGNRRSIRLYDADYGRPGLYFVSLVALDRNPLFGEIINSGVRLSPAGEIVREEWLRTPTIRREMVLDECIIMPDHFQAIIGINFNHYRPVEMGCVGAHGSAPCPPEDPPLFRPKRTLGSFIRAVCRSRRCVRAAHDFISQLLGSARQRCAAYPCG